MVDQAPEQKPVGLKESQYVAAQRHRPAADRERVGHIWRSFENLRTGFPAERQPCYAIDATKRRQTRFGNRTHGGEMYGAGRTVDVLRHLEIAHAAAQAARPEALGECLDGRGSLRKDLAADSRVADFVAAFAEKARPAVEHVKARAHPVAFFS